LIFLKPKKNGLDCLTIAGFSLRTLPLGEHILFLFTQYPNKHDSVTIAVFTCKIGLDCLKSAKVDQVFFNQS
jgi:hypothetical protein